MKANTGGIILPSGRQLWLLEVNRSCLHKMAARVLNQPSLNLLSSDNQILLCTYPIILSTVSGNLNRVYLNMYNYTYLSKTLVISNIRGSSQETYSHVTRSEDIAFSSALCTFIYLCCCLDIQLCFFDIVLKKLLLSYSDCEGKCIYCCRIQLETVTLTAVLHIKLNICHKAIWKPVDLSVYNEGSC